MNKKMQEKIKNYEGTLEIPSDKQNFKEYENACITWDNMLKDMVKSEKYFEDKIKVIINDIMQDAATDYYMYNIYTDEKELAKRVVKQIEKYIIEGK